MQDQTTAIANETETNEISGATAKRYKCRRVLRSRHYREGGT